MTGMIDWASSRARMILAFVLLSIAAGVSAYIGLPKEGEPDIEVPALFVSVPFPGISAEDSEKLLVKPLETKLQDLDGLKSMTSTAAEGYAGVALEFEFGWNKTETLADVRDKVNQAQASFPQGAEQYTINEINFSEFPILVISLSGDLPDRTLLRVAKDLQDRVEALGPVLEAGIAGERDEMLEVLIDPLKLEAYNVTAGDLINVVVNNNQLIAAGEVEGDSGAFSVKIPAAFDTPQDVYRLPVKVNGDRTITLGDLADIRLTFEDRTGTARYNGRTSVALQVVKRKGFNVIDTAELVRQTVADEVSEWPAELQSAIRVDFSMDTSRDVASMVTQLEASVLTAIALVMIVVLSALGIRSALLVGFAIPTSFMLCFALLAVFGMAISNIVMFGLILAVGMLVDGAIVVVEYADKRIQQGTGPMTAYREAAKRMFWPIVSSTATTLCAFLPMLFWPGVAGEFMGNLPVTLIFVLSASLIVALIYLPVVGGVAGRFSRAITRGSAALRQRLPWMLRAALTLPFVAGLWFGFLFLFSAGGALPGLLLFVVSWVMLSLFGGSLLRPAPDPVPQGTYRRTPFGRFIQLIAGNPVMPFVSVAAVAFFVFGVFGYFGENNKGVEFFVETEPERAIAYVRARGNLSLEEKDALVAEVEDIIAGTDGVESIFAFSGAGGLAQAPGSTTPLDAVGQVQIELDDWQARYALGPEGKGKAILARINERLAEVPGIEAEISEAAGGPAQGKPVHLRLKGDDWQQLLAATEVARAKFDATDTLVDVEDTRPLPGIDWQIDVDVEQAGRYGADVAAVGAMVQLVTRGLTLDTMRVDSSDEEIDIRVRLPEEDRVLSTLDTLRVRTNQGLVPLANFVTRQPVAKLGQIDRVDGQRYFDVKADVQEGGNATAEIQKLTEWLDAGDPLPAGVSYEWTGDQEDQAESQAFLMSAFMGALGLMFVILLAQFNSIYNALLVLLAVVLSVTGSLIGMLVMGQPFSIIMTGTGIVALAGIVVNNNIVLIDTYQEYSRYMPRIEAIVRTAEARIRPVLLTTITTIAGLTPMVVGLSVDFIGGGYSLNAPTALWWKQLATAVVFGLGVATVLTLVVTPAMLAVRVWAGKGAYGAWVRALALLRSRDSRLRRDLALGRRARQAPAERIIWDDRPAPLRLTTPVARAAE
ncbi:AcrB/AcrD/AcrF family protein [Rhodobacteraceae bacterium 2CG4]|uniref:AcrB/AcrD/AcrF family protein n=1 Tax=Halovulum marinum TaxID=2662447 RepID=A0A6L5YYJ0_9RHOB|nr:efflux RND transporter permease subunit [Halovulum marinum]MSU88970.1 AcrB/AcrD/AcrF family protein [Halovulum marinum]